MIEACLSLPVGFHRDAAGRCALNSGRLGADVDDSPRILADLALIARYASDGSNACMLDTGALTQILHENAATAFLIHGYIGAGKTTLARQLEQDEGAVRFTHDEWMAILFGDDPPENHFAEYAQRVSIVMEAMWTRCITLNTNVVLDFGFWSRRERDRVRSMVAEIGGKPVLYHVSCADDIAWRRVEKRNERLEGTLYIAPNTFQLLRARFEPLDADETRIVVAGGGS